MRMESFLGKIPDLKKPLPLVGDLSDSKHHYTSLEYRCKFWHTSSSDSFINYSTKTISVFRLKIMSTIFVI